MRRADREQIGAEAALIFNVSTLLQEPLGSQRVHAISDEGQVSRPALLVDDEETPVDGNVELIRTDGSILAIATLDLSVREVCDSCLEPFSQPLHLEMREEFWPERDPLSQEEVEVPEEREGFPVVEGHIDLREAIRQYVEMARPMRAHCGEACGGSPAVPFVTVTSESSARESGGSDEAPADDRWAALEALRDGIDSSGSAHND